jgi:NAD(P)-dependent dehydrogenase (short-subunit alcohol dehydrogenase family)
MLEGLRKVNADRKVYVITGPTSGIGRATALELARHGTVVLVGRDRNKLHELQTIMGRRGQQALAVVCDLSDPGSVRRAVEEIVALGLPIAGLLNNAGIMQMRPSKNALGWDMSFATNHLGPFALTEALIRHLPDGAHVVFVVSAVEDPGRKPAVAAGFRGGRYISVEASARGEWKSGGAKRPGFDAYATSKQALLAAALAFARETPRLRFNAVEPGVTPATALARDSGALVRLLSKTLIPLLVPLFMPFIRILSTPKRAARVLTRIMIDASGQTGVYYDEGGHPMRGSALVHDSKFQDRVVAETRRLLASVSV